MLPEGQDPDDLARSDGPAAIAEVLRRAQPLAEMLFVRETEGQRFDTPEKRAGLERRLRELVGSITDETLRRHYAADMDQRLAAFLGLTGPSPARRPAERGARSPRRPPFADSGPRVGIAGAALPTPRHLARRPREAPREIAILAILIGHPVLMERHFEEVAALEIASAGLAAFRDKLLALPAPADGGPSAWAEALDSAGLAGERARILGLAAGMPNWWCLRADAETSDAEHVLRQTMALQRSSGALNRELKLAEQALAADPTEQNLARLLDIKANLADLANAEAAIEGFGDLSGRGSAPL
jgi:DNA primase